MKLYLASSQSVAIPHILPKLGFDPQGKKLVFIKTASQDLGEETPDWIEEDLVGLRGYGFAVDDYSVTGKNEEELRQDLKDYDIMLVGGGNTYYLLQESQKSGFTKVVKELVEDGMIYIGSSAGSVIAGPDIASTFDLDDKSKAPELSNMTGYGLVDFVVLPHWGAVDWKDAYLKGMDFSSLYDMNIKLIMLRDTHYVEVDENGYKIVAVND